MAALKIARAVEDLSTSSKDTDFEDEDVLTENNDFDDDDDDDDLELEPADPTDGEDLTDEWEADPYDCEKCYNNKNEAERNNIWDGSEELLYGLYDILEEFFSGF